MHFASPIPLWAAAVVAAVLVGASVFVYRRPLVPLARAQRITLISLRAAALLLLLFFFCRPMVLAPPAAAGEAAVPVLVDASRSMAIPDADNATRLAAAVKAVENDVLPAVSGRFKPDTFAVGGTITAAAPGDMRAEAPETDLRGALATVRDRYRGRPIAGVVLLSDGGDTGRGSSAPIDVPVFAIGVGSAQGIPDREVTGIAAGDPRLDDASIDVHVTATSRGFGRAPFELRLSANGRLVESRRVTPLADGSPVDEVFTLTPDASAPTVVSAEIAQDPGERIGDNNTRSVLVSPHGRKRRVLMIEGAPGFEHSFLTRALAEDRDLELDSITRKGKNDAGQDTFFVQASGARAPALTSGFPVRREDLLGYDAVVIANVSADSFTRAQMDSLADFVSERGGGLLVMGGLSFAEHGLIGTPLETLLPVALGDRRGGVVRTSSGAELGAASNIVVPTPEGETHAVMRLGATPEQTRKKWAALPALAAVAPLGGPKAGATILAVATAPGGAVYPVIAVQQYGRGHSMVFGGEAAWRWRMLLPATDRTYETFWRQTARWLAASSPDPVSIATPEQMQPGDSVVLSADVRDAAFVPATDASISASVTGPAGQQSALSFRRNPADAKFVAPFPATEKGVYRVQLEASRGGTRLGAAERWFYVGGSDRELADPRLNEAALRRIARATGGQYVSVKDAGRVRAWLESRSAEAADLEARDLWQKPWMLAAAALLLSAEWILRRRWGLR